MSSVEPADFDDLLQAYDMDLTEPLVKASPVDESKDKTDYAASSGEETSWEVMEIGHSDASTSPGKDDPQQSKDKHDADDWVLEPDTERKSKDNDLPVIQSITSLREPEKADIPKSLEDRIDFDSSPEKCSNSDTGDSESMPVDPVVSDADQNKDSTDKTGLTNGSNAGDLHSERTSKTTSQKRTDQSNNTHVPTSESPSSQIDGDAHANESSGGEEGNAKVQGDENGFKSRLAISSDPKKTNSERSDPEENKDPTDSALMSDYGMEKGDKEQTIVVIEPKIANTEPIKWDHIKFTPGSIKQEPQATITPNKLSNDSISVTASLSTGTSLSSAIITQPSLAPSVHFSPTQPGSLPRTILRSPPGKPIPQFLFRHVGPGPRPSYVRLGTQALQQIARLTSPPGMASGQSGQRMISVLMDRSHTTVGTPGATNTFPQLVTGRPPGTFVTTGNPNSPLKVLILPSQANVPMTGVKNAPSINSAASFANLGVVSVTDSNVRPTPTSYIPADKVILGKNAASNGLNMKGSGGQKPGRKNGSKNSKNSSSQKVSALGEIGQNIALTEERFKRRMIGKVNLIKPHHPALNSAMANMGFGFFSCPGCRDVFVNKSSLELHKSRQSVMLSFNCDTCQRKLVFPNKCMFRCHMLLHVPELKNISKHLLDAVEIQTIPGPGQKQPKDAPLDSPQGNQSEITLDNSKPTPVTETTVEAEPVHGLTISSVSSISPDENIPVGDPPQTSFQMSTLSEKAPVIVKGIANEAAPLVTVTSSHLDKPQITSSPQPIINSQITSEPTKLGLKLSGVVTDKSNETAAPFTTSLKTVPLPVPITSSLAPSFMPLTCIVPKPLAPPPMQANEGGNVYCTECSKTFNSFMALQKHFNDADKSHPLKPPCCKKRLSTECCVRSHMRMHSSAKPYVCEDCGLYFRGSISIFKRHRDQCERIMKSAMIVFPCRKCTLWFERIDEFRHHIREAHSECYLKCNLCPMAFKSVPSFREHNSSKHFLKTIDSASYSSIYKCPLCDSVFHDQRLKFEHLNHHINNIYATQKVSFSCYICKKLSYSYTGMRNHLKDKHKIMSLGNMCDFCGVDCGPISGLVKHLKEEHRAIPANMLVVPATVREIQAAVGETEKEEPKTEVPSKEPTPQPETSPTDNKQAIVRTKSEVESKEEADTPVDTTSSRDTTSPGNVSRSSSMYSEVASEDTPGGNGKSMKCHICLSIFPNRKALIRHKKMDHGLMKRRRKRGDAAAVVPEKKVKIEDMKTPELQVKSDFMLRFECDDCEYRTTSFADLQDHRMGTHGIEARFPCHLCGHTFESLTKVDEHQKATHEGSVRIYPYMCWLCEKESMRKGYTKRALLVKHMMNFHKIPSRSIDTQTLDKLDEKARLDIEQNKEGDGVSKTARERSNSTKDDSFTCVKCNFHCESREVFTEHIYSHRLASDSFLCHECGMCFTVLTALRNHLRLVHRIKKFDAYVEKYKLKICSPSDKAKKLPKVKKAGPRKVGNALECTVCYKRYPDENSLKNHMRSHGMAFIRSKRLAPMAFISD